MAETARITITIPIALKQALVERAQLTGQTQTQLVVQGIEVLLASGQPATLQALQGRVEHLEWQMQALLSSGAPPTPLSQVVPAPDPIPEEPSPPSETPDPRLWDPVEYSFDDWLFQIWHTLSMDLTGQSWPWGHSIPVERLHQLAFYEMRYRRFIDRLLTSEAPGLRLLPDETSQLGLGDCQPGALTFEECETTGSDAGSDPVGSNGNGSHSLPPLDSIGSPGLSSEL